MELLRWWVKPVAARHQTDRVVNVTGAE